jgi:hypothetical protein
LVEFIREEVRKIFNFGRSGGSGRWRNEIRKGYDREGERKI